LFLRLVNVSTWLNPLNPPFPPKILQATQSDEVVVGWMVEYSLFRATGIKENKELKLEAATKK